MSNEPYTLRELAEMVAAQYPDLPWYHGDPEPGTETAAQWAASCAKPESKCSDLHLVWSEDGSGSVLVQAITGDTANAAVRAAYFANLSPDVVLDMLDALDAMRALTYEVYDEEFAHTHADTDLPYPTCPACWAREIRKILDGEGES